MIGVMEVDDLEGEYLLAVVYHVTECDPKVNDAKGHYLSSWYYPTNWTPCGV
jgi:hypothetical protein